MRTKKIGLNYQVFSIFHSYNSTELIMRAFVDVSYFRINLRLKITPPLPKELDVKYIIISLLDRATGKL